MIDRFSQRIVGWPIKASMKTQLVAAALVIIV